MIFYAGCTKRQNFWHLTCMAIYIYKQRQEIIMVNTFNNIAFRHGNVNGRVVVHDESYQKFKRRGLCLAIMPLLAAAISMPVTAQDDDVVLEELVVSGTRSTKPRTASDSPVPIDVFNAAELASIGGGVDITDSLNTLIPSYLAAPATGDGSAFVRPTSLRGLASDQTLVLVNGKRRHRSSLVQLFAPAANNGSHGTDIAMIPSIGLKSVEVLRDGASAQYGSDAIAGVINFQLKDAAEGGSIEASYGEHFEGEESLKLSANAGFALGTKGFVNVSLEEIDNEALSRGIQSPVAQDLIDSGVEGVGEDAVFGDAPLVQTWGRPETSATRFVFNSGYEIHDNMEVYGFGNYAKTDGRYRFFYRDPTNSDLLEALDKGATNLEREAAAGYTPYLDGAQTDYSLAVGLKGVLPNYTTYDVSLSTGRNSLDYTLHNSLNGDADLVDGNAVRVFDTGDYEQEEIGVNVDFGTALTSNLFLSYGAEYREETFTQEAGELAAYIGGGVSGLAGTRPEDAGEHSRDNYAIYGDLEHDISGAWFMQYALRYEDFSDFGDTVNWKVATRYRITPTVALRGSVSTGFHAPTPGQSNLRSTTTSFDNLGNQIDIGLLPADSAEVASLGGTALTEEEAVNYSLGFTADISDATTLTVDAYYIEVDGRIYRTEIDNVSFYTNALDLLHHGVDVVLTSGFDWANYSTNVVFAYTYGVVEVRDNNNINGAQVVSDDLVEDIETNYPNEKFTLSSTTVFNDKLSLLARVRYIGDHFDERGNIDGTSANGTSQEIDPVLYTDIELSYTPNDSWVLALGGSNIFDVFPDTIDDEEGVANRISVGLPYPRRSVANYEGGSWYAKATYKF